MRVQRSEFHLIRWLNSSCCYFCKVKHWRKLLLKKHNPPILIHWVNKRHSISLKSGTAGIDYMDVENLWVGTKKIAYQIIGYSEEVFWTSFFLVLMCVCLAKISLCTDVCKSNIEIPKMNAKLHPHVQLLTCVPETQDSGGKQGNLLCRDFLLTLITPTLSFWQNE